MKKKPCTTAAGTHPTVVWNVNRTTGTRNTRKYVGENVPETLTSYCQHKRFCDLECTIIWCNHVLMSVCYVIIRFTREPHLSGAQLAVIFTYAHTCLGTNSHFLLQIESLIREFSYTDSQLGNRGVRISEAPLYYVMHVSSRSSLAAWYPHGGLIVNNFCAAIL